MRKLLLALALMLGLPAAANADVARVQDGVLRYDASRDGRQDWLSISRTGGTYLLRQPRGMSSDRVPGPGCRDYSGDGLAPGFECDAAGVTRIEVALYDGDDSLNLERVDVPVSYSGGDGRDRIYNDRGPLFLTNDDVADDGRDRRDNVLSDVEDLNGTDHADIVGAGIGGTNIYPRGGDDLVSGGPGDSRIYSASTKPPPTASLEIDPEGRDTIGCGDGYDIVIGDVSDLIGGDCEVVGRDGVIVRKQPGYEVRGSPFAETIRLELVITDNWLPTLLRGGGGDDTLSGAADISGGAGDDRLIKTTGKRQSFRGDSGNDRIDVRDQNPAKRVNDDSVRCGSGRDKVYADSADRVSKDCERVLR